jgi:transposase-like protein
VVERWVENPYWQVFCGFDHLQLKLPIDPSSLVRWRRRVGQDGIAFLLQETIAAATRGQAVKAQSSATVTVLCGDRFMSAFDRRFDPEVREVRRLEVITGALGRRRWSAEAKARIVAESLAPGVVISEVARRHDLRPQQLFAWRHQARQGRLALPAAECRSCRWSARPMRRPLRPRPRRSG